MVKLDGVKMSKSLGNLVMAREVLARVPGDAMRLYLSNHHYRQEWDWKEPELQEALGWARRVAAAAGRATDGAGRPPFDGGPERVRFLNAMDDDLNTPEAIRALCDLAEGIDQKASSHDVGAARETLRDLGGRVLGLTFEL
jgi:cysteinyl-tRNA synthetase